MFDPHVYMSLISINETDLSENPSLPVATLPDIMPSTVSSTYILEALGAPVPPMLPSYSRG